ncbi:Cross-pathway control protein 1 [Daldinia childiae]|uniref:Cross-pathway control protein 1 n=1 Tax=Daldinia childiae TaxID=326645 RepID=UPI0014461CB8|nr:Cross-pathway control protein 1 [Daldinia childiae]KAF3068440.1 Cross-pathway control protein 1 [Daldinia childiae]
MGPSEQYHKQTLKHSSKCAKQTRPRVSSLSHVLSVATVKIQSPKNNNYLPTQPFFSALPFQEELNSNEAIHSSPSSLTTANIPQQDSLVFTTDSQQQTWLPSSSPSLPAQSAQSSFPPPQQDFVLFDQPQPQRQNVNRSVSSPASVAVSAFGSLNVNPSRSPHISNGSSPSIQNQRVAQIIRATGHQTSSSTAFTNQFNSSVHNQNLQQYYASISPLRSTAAANQNRVARPPVPLFTQGGSNQQAARMDLQDALSLEDLTAFQGPTTAYSSPGIPGYDVSVSSASSTASNMGTISPQDLFLDPTTSAPNSTAITNLTSPSMYDGSPELQDYEFELSPNLGNNDFDHGFSRAWPSLFPEETPVVNTASTGDELSPAQQSDELEVAETASKPRRKSGHSPSSGNHGRHSSVSGVNPRRRDKPLPPIVVDDPNDSVAMKRARNTLAARKSRERKAIRFEELEAKIAGLEKERDFWKRRCEALESQTG